MSRSIFTIPLLGALALTSGCAVAPQDAEAEATSTSTEALSITSWSAATMLTGSNSESYRGAQVATLDGVTYMVHSGRCGAWSCNGSGESKELYWTKLTSTGWAPHQRISDQYAAHRVSLAAFNGSLYMIHTGKDDGATNLWLSRFSPATQTWSPNYQLSYSSKGGPPAIAAYGGVLRFVGVDPSTSQLWTATMTTAEIFSAAQALPGQYSSSRVSAAVYGTKLMPAALFIAHRAGSTTDVVYNWFNGTSWGTDQTIPAGGAGGVLQATEPVLASTGGYLHLIHRRPGSNYVWWTYYNGTSWPGEVTLGNRSTSYDPSLCSTTNGMMLVTTTDDTWNWVIESRFLWTQTYTNPAPVFDPGLGIAP
jgi:hypothetical protein